MQEISKLKGLSEWPGLRTQIEAAVRGILGEIETDRVELQMKTLDEVSFPGYTRRRVNYFVDEWERVSAWLFVPDGRDEVPGILCCHQAVPQGKDEPAGVKGDPRLAFAQRYAEMGYVTIAPDCITSGERQSHGLQPYDTKSFYKDNPKRSVLAKMLQDHTFALDALCDLKRVDPARLGVIGHSLGGTNAILLSAFDQRVQCCVSSCGFTRFADDKNPDRWSSENGFVQLPKLREAVQKKTYPFDWDHLLALVAPSPTLIITSLNDEVLSNPKSCEKAVKAAKTIYKYLGAADALGQYSHHAGHGMTQQALEQADDWFERWL
ncbi:MAG TPA: prolyl oligopeptidase family serine peptidase [Candidatus Hydrogenedentes bacterium]|nr:prolyl oligopeptidase family serine peptidase [Candidatus Hydrogenedentota bacterium]